MATQKKNSWQSIARLRGRITTPTQATSAYRGAVEWDARFHRARVFPCSSMLIMRPMRSRGNEVMCVCVVPSVTMSLAVVYAKGPAAGAS